MNNILITGANGQLGSEFRAIHKEYPQWNFTFTCKDELDICDKEKIEQFCKEKNISYIVNCAAYTAVDNAQNDFETALKINHEAVRNLALTCKEFNIGLIHVSTDYVFDGFHYKPYTESDNTDPKTAYGQTKLLGENEILKINPPNSLIIRTSWVYSSFGKNFVKTMLRLGKEKQSIGVVYDQIGSPTYARDLAKAILDILPNIQNSTFNIYHYSNEGAISWFDFAKEIMKMAKLTCAVNPILSKDYSTPTARPHYSLLDKSKIKNQFDLKIPYWKDSLDACLKELGERR